MANSFINFLVLRRCQLQLAKNFPSKSGVSVIVFNGLFSTIIAPNATASDGKAHYIFSKLAVYVKANAGSISIVLFL